jgi:hypothetical protein
MGDLVWWYISVIPATWEVETGGSLFKASPGKKTYGNHIS